MINITDQDSDEVVAIEFSDDIYFGQTAIDKAIQEKDFTKLYFRDIFKFICWLDPNPKWAEYAEYPTLFTITEYNNWVKLSKGKPICR